MLHCKMSFFSSNGLDHDSNILSLSVGMNEWGDGFINVGMNVFMYSCVYVKQQVNLSSYDKSQAYYLLSNYPLFCIQIYQ